MGKEVLPDASEADIELMTTLLAKGDIKHKYAVRIQTVLNRAHGTSTNDTATVLGLHIMTVSRYVHRFNEGGVDSLLRDKTRKPGKNPISTETKNELCSVACKERPENATHWSTRELAKRMGISHTAVNLILRERGIRPHAVESFQFSTDPDFAKKLEDAVGLYLAHKIQALERSQPTLPLLPGVPER